MLDATMMTDNDLYWEQDPDKNFIPQMEMTSGKGRIT